MQVGHTFTIEPMINEGTDKHIEWADGWTACTRDGKRSAQFEHTLLVTPDGVEVTSTLAPPPTPTPTPPTPLLTHSYPTPNTLLPHAQHTHNTTLPHPTPLLPHPNPTPTPSVPHPYPIRTPPLPHPYPTPPPTPRHSRHGGRIRQSFGGRRSKTDGFGRLRDVYILVATVLVGGGVRRKYSGAYGVCIYIVFYKLLYPVLLQLLVAKGLVGRVRRKYLGAWFKVYCYSTVFYFPGEFSPFDFRSLSAPMMMLSLLSVPLAFHAPIGLSSRARGSTIMDLGAMGLGGGSTSTSTSDNSARRVELAARWMQNEGFYQPVLDKSMLSDDFVFMGPVVGPLNKADYLGTLGVFKIYEAFPDITVSASGFTQDPTDPVCFFLVFFSSLDPFLPYVRAHSSHISPFNSFLWRTATGGSFEWRGRIQRRSTQGAPSHPPTSAWSSVHRS